MRQYASTSTICSAYEVDSAFFLRRKKDGVFVENKHYIQQGNTLRWDVEELEAWWRGDDSLQAIKNAILKKVLI